MKTYLLVIIISLSMMVGCSHKITTSVADDMPEKYNYSAPYDTTSVTINLKWWHIFGDSTLNYLIETALRNNQDVLSAYSRIEQSRLQYKVDRAAFLPQLSLDLYAEDEYSREYKIEQEYSAKPTVSWEISLFGSLKNSTKMARANILSSEYNHAAVMLALAAEVATNYFTLIMNRQSLEISKVTYNSRTKSMAIIDSLVAYGMSTSLELKQSQGLTATAAAAIPQYERAIAQSQNALSLLLGEMPRTINTAIDYRGGYSTLPEYIPAGLPSDLLLRRPDIMESYAALVVASAKIGIAKAARLPSLSLTAGGGLLSTTWKTLVSSNPYALAWNSIVSFSQPIYQFGKLKSSQKIAEEGYKQAEYNYYKSVITALSDVDNALIAISTLHRQSVKYNELVESNIKIQNMTSQLYKEGLVDYLNLLDAERTLYSSQLEYSALLAEHYTAYVDLYKALGGGW